MPKLALLATVEVAAGRRDQILPLLQAHGVHSLATEPGTVKSEVPVPRENDSKLFIYEVYRDDAAVETHRNADPIARFRREGRSPKCPRQFT